MADFLQDTFTEPMDGNFNQDHKENVDASIDTLFKSNPKEVKLIDQMNSNGSSATKLEQKEHRESTALQTKPSRTYHRSTYKFSKMFATRHFSNRSFLQAGSMLLSP